jgi:hypothetical protein
MYSEKYITSFNRWSETQGWRQVAYDHMEYLMELKERIKTDGYITTNEKPRLIEEPPYCSD